MNRERTYTHPQDLYASLGLISQSQNHRAEIRLPSNPDTFTSIAYPGIKSRKLSSHLPSSPSDSGTVKPTPLSGAVELLVTIPAFDEESIVNVGESANLLCL